MRAAGNNLQIGPGHGVKQGGGYLADAAANLLDALTGRDGSGGFVSLFRGALTGGLVKAEGLTGQQRRSVDGPAGQIDIGIAVGILRGLSGVGRDQMKVGLQRFRRNGRLGNNRINGNRYALFPAVQRRHNPVVQQILVDGHPGLVLGKGKGAGVIVKGLNLRVHRIAGDIGRNLLHLPPYRFMVVAGGGGQVHAVFPQGDGCVDPLAKRRLLGGLYGRGIGAANGIGLFKHVAQITLGRHIGRIKGPGFVPNGHRYGKRAGYFGRCAA